MHTLLAQLPSPDFRQAAEQRWQDLSAGADTATATAVTADALTLCAGAALTDYFVAWSDFRGLDRWLGRWTQHAAVIPVPAGPPAQAAADRLHRVAAQLCAARLDPASAGADEGLQTGLDEALGLLRTLTHTATAPLTPALLHAPVLLECCQVLRRPSIAQELEWHITRHPGWPSAPPAWQARLLDSLAATYFVLDLRADAERCEAQARQIADAHGLGAMQFELLKRPVRLALEDGAHAQAGELLDAMARQFDPRHLGSAVEYWDLRGRWLLATGQEAAAADAMTRADELAALGELPIHRRVVLWTMTSAIHVALHRQAPALAALARARDAVQGNQATILDASLATVRAWFSADAGAADAADQLRAAFRALSALNLVRFLRPLPQIAARLCQAALEAGSDPVFIARVIAERRLQRPETAGAAWPSAVRVFCLGLGELAFQDIGRAPRGKLPAKSLELLWMIGAHDGDPVPVTTLMKTLWPDADGAAARAAFDMALARLRRLLGDDRWLTLEGGRLQADPQALWFDTAQQRALVQRLTQPGLTAGAASAQARQLVAGYGGVFAGQLPDSAWVLAARERQQARFARGVRAAVEVLRTAGDADAAEALLQSAVEAAPTSEALASALIALQRDRGDLAQAQRTLQHLALALDAADMPPPSLRTRQLAGH